MHILKTNFDGNPNVGLYMFCNNKYCLVPRNCPEKLFQKLKLILKVKVHRITIAGTSLIGVFVSGNNNGILVPKITFEEEIRQLDKLNIRYNIIDTRLTALGNNILCNDNSCLINPDYEKDTIKIIEAAVEVPVKKAMINDLHTIGSMAKLTNFHGLVHHDIKDFEQKFIEKNMKIKLTRGTVNFGSPYISSGVICNKNGFVIGDLSGGPEIANADEALGFVKGD
ncbi:translation initiation factor IF-6 [Candidatus Woesearchaeota archaeon]|nr:translation initiation factor IF-6 [Candidatus Woesearchaeota archaeon]